MNPEEASAAIARPAADLMDAFGAVRNWRAIALTLASMLVVVCLAGLSGYLAMHMGFLGFFGMLLTLAAAVVGFSAVGAQLLSESKNIAAPSLVESVLIGIASAPRLIGAAFCLLAIVLALIFALAIVLFVCKIPYLGGVLYAVVLPVGSVVLGLALFGTFNVSLAILAPAVWEGHSVFASISRLLAVLRQRPLEVLIRLFLLGCMVALTAAVVGGILSAGYLTVQGMAAAMHVGMGTPGFDGGFERYGLASDGISAFVPYSGVSGWFYGGAPGGTGGIVGSAILFAIGSTLPMLVLIKGLCIVYLRLMSDLDLVASDALLQESLDRAREKARQAAERAASLQAAAKEAAARAQTKMATTEAPSAPPPSPAPVPALLEPDPSSPATDETGAAAVAPVVPVPPTDLAPEAPPAGDNQPSVPPLVIPARRCSQCNAALADDDLFCGECGTRNAPAV
jgi:hypothetical protein